MPDINLSQKTNLLEQDPYSYELQDVKNLRYFTKCFRIMKRLKLHSTTAVCRRICRMTFSSPTRHSAMASSRVLRIRRSR